MKLVRAITLICSLFLAGCGIGLCTDAEMCTGGAISLSDTTLTLRALEIDDSKITLAWVPATGAGPFTYSIFLSTAANLDSIANTRANGTLVGTVVAGSSYTFTGLTIDKDYYFRVIVSSGESELAYDMRSPFCGGTGTAGSPYQICDAGSMQYVSLHLGENFQITRDFDLSDTTTWNSGKGFTPIGTDTARFTGTLDGQNYRLLWLYSNRGQMNCGLFGSISSTAAISNTRVEMALIEGCFALGGILVGESYGTITSSHSSGAVKGDAASGSLGGLVGKNNGAAATITNSSSSADVSALGQAGGLVGYNVDGVIRGSKASGNVVTTAGTIGGLVGMHSGNTALIQDCYAEGNGHSTVGAMVGGLVGQVSFSATVDRSYAIGNVMGLQQIGGLAGNFVSGAITNSFATGNVYATLLQGGLIGENNFVPGVSNSYWYDHVNNGANCYSGGDTNCTIRTNPTWFFDITNLDGGGGELNFFSASTAWIMPKDGRFPRLAWERPNPPIAFPPEFRNGRKISYNDASAYRVWGYCGTSGAAISFGGPGAPTSTTCTGGTWSTTWDFSAQADGNIDITVQQGSEKVVSRRLVKDTDSCSAVLNAETLTAAIDARFGAGGGPHVICNVQQMGRLQAVTGNWAKSFILGANIDMTTYASGPIGTTVTNFTGSFDGDGFYLRNISRAFGVSYAGLFGQTNHVLITNLGLENVNISGNNYTGGIAGQSTCANPVRNSYVTGFVSGGIDVAGLIGSATCSFTEDFFSGALAASSSEAGGIAGVAAGAGNTLNNSFAIAYIKGLEGLGGIAGYVTTADFHDNYADAIIDARWLHLGPSQGTAGALIGTGPGILQDTVTDCYSTGRVYGFRYLGALTGMAGTLRRSYSTASVFGSTRLGGLSGISKYWPGSKTEIFDSFFTGKAAAVGASATTYGALAGGDLESTNNYYLARPDYTIQQCAGTLVAGACTEASNDSDFHSRSHPAFTNWDFDTKWKFPEAGGMPILKWQHED